MEFEEIAVVIQDKSSSEVNSMIRNFEAGGTQIWGAEFEPDSDEMSNLTPIQEDGEGGSSVGTPADRGSYMETSSFTESPGPMRRRHSNFRTSLMKNKQLWQRAAKQARSGGNLENRRKSILPFVDIDLETSTSSAAIDDDDDDDDDEDDGSIVFSNSHSISNGKSNGTSDNIAGTHSLQVPQHVKVLPLSSLDIERDIKPQLKPARKFLGFIFPKMPTQFSKVNEIFFQRYYSHKRKKTMLMVNILYSVLLVILYILKLLPMPTDRTPLDIAFIARETIITASMIAGHITACVLIRRANTDSGGGVPKCAYITWILLLLHTLLTPITSFIDYQLTDGTKTVPWETFGTWQTALVVLNTFGFLSVLPLRRVLTLSVIVVLLHLISAGVMTGLYKIDCLPRMVADIPIMLAVLTMGLFNYYLIERTERKAFLEIRTCIESRHTIAKENQQQERLVLSVLPKFIVRDIMNDDHNSANGPFFNMYIHRYECVSILFADICGFTTLGSRLTAKQLVSMLNDLFASFDKLAKRYKCLRIKLLGDCYEAVCGIPDSVNDHADNCVEMGLEMISVIRLVREQQQVDCLNMRIGVHTGSVFCGVLGLRKWQFDIYSDDVKTANAMESSGEKGRVHISEATRNALTRTFEMEPNDQLDNEYLNGLELKTYFIQPPKELEPEPSPNLLTQNNNRRKVSILMDRRHTIHSVDGGDCIGCELQSRLPPAFRHSTDNAVNNMIQRATDSKADDKLSKEFVNPVHLNYKDMQTEQKYRKNKDDAFQTNALSFVIMITTVLVTQIVSNMSMDEMYWVGPLMTGIVLLLSTSGLISIVMYRLMIRYKYQKSMQSDGASRDSLISELKELKASTLPGSYTVRNSIITAIVTLLFLSTLFHSIYEKANDLPYGENCYNTYMWMSWLMVMISTASFLKWTYMIKVSMIVIMLVSFIVVREMTCSVGIQETYNSLLAISLNATSASDSSGLYGHMKFYNRVEYIIVILFAAVLLIYHSRVLDLHARLDFLWRLQAKQELEEMDSLRENNMTLLRNILPEHVANNFLGKSRRDEELYCESYENVAVMFAAISNFNEFWLAVIANGHGRGCLTILNEIIADFDELLGQPQFLEVEKVKTIGSTYMACVGLSPVQKSENDVWQNLKTCVDLAFAMKSALYEINQNTFDNNFQLRIGINQGPVVAGVIGARKPHYDIWGHTVNLASRMESNCKAGEVLVMKDTANILKQHHYPTKYRDIIPVKGISEPQKVYTVLKPSESAPHPLTQRRGSMAVAPPSMKTFNDVVQKLMKSPSTRKRLKKDDSVDELDDSLTVPT